MIDVKSIQELARKEIREETTKSAVARLKELYAKQEKARLVVRNIDREIESYLAEIEDCKIYESAGVDTTTK